MSSVVAAAGIAGLVGCSSILGITEPSVADAGGPGDDSSASFALTVVASGGTGAGRSVTTGDGSIDCGATCSHSYASGTRVTLTATAVIGKGLSFQTWTGDCASSINAPTCTVTLDRARSVGATFAPVNYVFVSAMPFIPSQGVLAGDTLCQDEANAHSLPDANRYIAWLSTLNGPARGRLQGARGWVRLDGLPVLDSPSDTTHILYPPRLGSLGQDLTSVSVITGTDASGAAAANCLDYTSNAAMQLTAQGIPGSGAGGWTNATNTGCNRTDLHVYCFGTAAVSPVVPPAMPGRRAFASDGTFDPSTGRGAADTLCRGEATANGFAGDYLALISLLTSAASERFDTAGLPWVRPDGVALAAQPSDLFAGDGLIAAFDVTGTIKYLDHNDRIWTGSDKPNTAGMFVPTTCNDWSDPLGSGAVGAPDTTAGFGYFHADSPSCDTPHRVYCLQR